MRGAEVITEATLDVLARLRMFKHTRINFCNCTRTFPNQFIRMKLHNLYRCTFCGGKVNPEKVKYSEEVLK